MRLTYRDNTVPHTNAKGELWEAYSDENYNEVINKLAAYEDAEEQGLLVRLPCKVGDTFYYIAGTLRGNEYVTYNTVAAIEISDTETWIIDLCGCHHIEFWMTRAEAEAALKDGEDTGTA